jgi:hypothetical protein
MGFSYPATIRVNSAMPRLWRATRRDTIRGMTLVIINTLDAGPHAKGAKVLQVRDRRWEMEIEFDGTTYHVFAYRLNDEGKHHYTRLAAEGQRRRLRESERGAGGRCFRAKADGATGVSGHNVP